MGALLSLRVLLSCPPSTWEVAFMWNFRIFLNSCSGTEVLKSIITVKFYYPPSFCQCHVTIQSYRNQIVPFYSIENAYLCKS